MSECFIAVLSFSWGFMVKRLELLWFYVQKSATQVCICVAIWPFCVAKCSAIPDKLFPAFIPILYTGELEYDCILSLLSSSSCISWRPSLIIVWWEMKMFPEGKKLGGREKIINRWNFNPARAELDLKDAEKSSFQVDVGDELG